MNALFLTIEFAMTSAALLGAYHMRGRFGMGPVVAVVAAMQLLQAILSASFYWDVAGVSLTPGSCVLFASNLAILLYASARHGALSARIILYGILIANVVIVSFGAVIALHIHSAPPTNLLEVPVALFEGSLISSVVGIAMLYGGQILAVLAFTAMRRRWPALPVFIPMTVTLVAALALDTVGFLSVVMWSHPQFGDMLMSGVVSKGLGGVAYGVTWGLLLQRRQSRAEGSLVEVLNVLLLREDLASLREAASTDELTRLFNRRTFNLIVERLLERPDTETFALLLIDADGFKAVNDRLGHATGDAVLVKIADALRAATREQDFCCRIGGDEFAVLLPGCDGQEAETIAARVVSFSFEDEGLEQPVTLTIGVASAPADGEAKKDLLEAADARLYTGKAEGKRRVVGPSAS